MLLTPISNPDEGKFNSNKEISFQAGKETHSFRAGAGGEAVKYTPAPALYTMCGAGLGSE